MKIKKTKYGKIILNLLREAYYQEVVSTAMEEHIIGEGKDYVDKEDWIQFRLDALCEVEE